MTCVRRSACAFLGTLCALLMVVTPARAEWFGDLWAGVSRTSSENLKLTILDVTAADKVNYSTTGTGGARVGYWFEGLSWLGLAVDGSYFRPDPDVSVIPVSALLMLRIPLLRSADVPRGRLQPYVAGGPGLFVSRFSGDLGEDLGGEASDTSYDLGLDARAGLTFLFTRDFGVFLEFRHTRVSPEWKLRVMDMDATVKTDLHSNHIMGGLTFRFDF